MERIFPLDRLDIIGCKEVPVLQPAMPRLLSPIFAVRDTGQVLFPPYTLGDEEVIRPELSNSEEFEALVARDDISAFGPVPAEPGNELWLDDMGKIRYDPGHVARNELTRIFNTRCDAAESALRSELFAEARMHAMAAYSANPMSLKPLVYRAAAEHRMVGHTLDATAVRAELVLTEILAASHLTIREFRSLYLDLARKTCVAVEAGAPLPKSENLCKFDGIATVRPKSAGVELLQHAFA